MGRIIVCSECGASVAADARFCASCGTPLDDPAVTGTTPATTESTPSTDTLPSAPTFRDKTSAPDDTRPRRSRAKTVFPVCIGLLLVGGIVAVAMFTASSGSDNSKAAEPKTPATTDHPAATTTDPAVGQAITAADAVDSAVQLAAEEYKSVNAKYPGTKDGPFYDQLGKIYDYVAVDLQTSVDDDAAISYPPAAIAEVNAALAAVRAYAAASHDSPRATNNTAPRQYIDRFTQTQLEAHSAIDALRTKLHSLAGSQPW